MNDGKVITADPEGRVADTERLQLETLYVEQGGRIADNEREV